MKLQPIYVLLAAALLALGACTNTKAVGDAAAQRAAEQRAAAAEAALEDLRASLEPGKDNAERRERVENAQKEVKQVRERVADQPNSPAKTAALTALGDVDEALKAIDDLLEANAALSSAVPASLTSMHTELDQALAALDTAQASLTAALAAEPSTEIKTLLAQAQAALSTAQVSLVPELRRELAVVQERADAEKERADAEKERADAEKERADAEKERADARRGGTTLGEPIAPERLTRNIVPALSTGGTANVTWTARTATGDDPLVTEAVLWADGKKLISASGIGTDEFKLRGITARGELSGPDETGNLLFHGGIEGGGAAALGVTTGNTAWDHTDAEVLSSIRLKRDGSGFTMKMGGRGNIFYDMERLAAIGPSTTFSNQDGNGACANVNRGTCDDPTTSDITAVFDNPAMDPDGDASYHFSMVVPVNPETPHTEDRPTGTDQLPDWLKFTNPLGERAYRVSDDAGPYEDKNGKYKVVWELPADAPDGGKLLEYRRAARIAAGLPVDQLGVYTVKLSNYAGKEGTTSTDSYLSYAAYGLFNFLDYSTTWPQFSRMQAFHFGYDAFTDDNKPRDFSDDAKTATFNGKTTGWILRNPDGRHISQLVRLRGDVALTATLGGGVSDGTISGTMENFEFLRNGAWSTLPVEVLAHGTQKQDNGVNLESAEIGTDGSYAGVAKLMSSANKRFGEGRYGGSLYGPRELGKLETAGYWMLPRHIGDDSSFESCHTARARTSCITFGSIIGSFGAKSEAETN